LKLCSSRILIAVPTKVAVPLLDNTWQVATEGLRALERLD